MRTRRLRWLAILNADAAPLRAPDAESFARRDPDLGTKEPPSATRIRIILRTECPAGITRMGGETSTHWCPQIHADAFEDALDFVALFTMLAWYPASLECVSVSSQKTPLIRSQLYSRAHSFDWSMTSHIVHEVM
jgi:hypothetical protein